MKTLNLVWLSCLFITVHVTFAYGQIARGEEKFESEMPPQGWQVVDRDGSGTDNNNDTGDSLVFVQRIDTLNINVMPQSGLSFWSSNVQNANLAGVIDEWLISPKIPASVMVNSLYFWAGSRGGPFHDSLRVLVSTADSVDLASFEPVFPPTRAIVPSRRDSLGFFKVEGLDAGGPWHEYGFDLSKFQGSDIFFAVNYYIQDGGPGGRHSDFVWIDHFRITGSGVVGIAAKDDLLPTSMALHQNYPNPFNAGTHIEYALDRPAEVRLILYNVLGQEVMRLVDQSQTAGRYRVAVNGGSLSSGIYVYRLQAGGFIQTRKMLLVK